MAATYQKTVPFPANASFIEGYASAHGQRQPGLLVLRAHPITFIQPTRCTFTAPTRPRPIRVAWGLRPATWLPLPANGVIYVANLPSTSEAAHYLPGGLAVVGGPGRRPGHCLGNAFVEGTVDGQVTVATDNNIYLVAPTADNGNATWGAQSLVGGDVMGLAASKFILVNHDISGGPDNFGPGVCMPPSWKTRPSTP